MSEVNPLIEKHSDIMSEEISDNEVLLSSSSSRKRKSYGRMKDVAKKLRLSTHETGADCKCLKLKCF